MFLEMIFSFSKVIDIPAGKDIHFTTFFFLDDLFIYRLDLTKEHIIHITA